MEKTIDNFDIIAKHMSFDNDDEFYFVQAVVRKKDGCSSNPDGDSLNGNNKNRLVRIWTIRSVEELYKLKQDIMNICDSMGARAYIHPTKRSFKDVGKEYMRLSMETFLSENYQGLKTAYSSACGMSFIRSDKKWVIDVDYDAIGGLDEETFIKEINISKPNDVPDKILYKVPTAHGYHLITTPFDLRGFERMFPYIDIHKNNPTLLYFKTNEDN